ncbi:MAG: glycosyltransferase [Bacteroidaceae bacterium]|nr:glycosyltransferase [Bacteroidaceae bacterium]
MEPTTDITVITVTYNCASTLERTLQSVERQTLSTFQHLIIDGASHDDTVRIAEAYRERNPQRDIIVQSEPDHGLYDAMNKGIHMAEGDFIVFLNAGDMLHADDVLARVAACDAEKVGVVYGETDIVDEQGQFLRHRRLSAPEHLTSRSFLRGMVVCHQSFYANRCLVQPYDLQYKYSADVDWCIRVMEACEKQGLSMYNLHAVLTDYLSEGMTTQHQRASLLERFRIMCRRYGYFAALRAHIYIIGRSIVKK